MDLQCPENTAFKNLSSWECLRGLVAKKFTQICLRLPVLGKCLKWVFQVSLRRVPVGRDSLEVKKIIKVKFLWITVVAAWRFYVWVSVFMEKRPRYVFLDTLSYIAVPKWFNNGFVYICQNDSNQFCDITYTRSLTESKIF